MRPRSAALVAAASALVLGVGACSADHGGDHAGPVSSASAAAAGDVAFAQAMVPHHQQAVEMADIALGHPDASAEVRSLATSIKAAQDPEIDTMTRWLSRWGAPTMGGDHSGHDMAGMMSDADLSALRAATGSAFNRSWLEMMIEHHRGAVSMAEEVLTTTKDAAVTALAKAVLATQQAEIAAMEKLLA